MSRHIALEDLDWAEDAVATIVGLAASGLPFTAEDLRREMREAPHCNMYGIAFTTAKGLGYIRPIGYRTSTTPTRKRGVLRVWERIEGDAA
jgi:adenosine/AMP kinase